MAADALLLLFSAAGAIWVCMAFLHTLTRWLRRIAARPAPIPDALWQRTLAHYSFLPPAGSADAARLQRLAAHFLASKEFSGAHGLRVRDHMAVAVAAQACLPLLHLGPPDAPERALVWYGNFVGIVLYPGAALAPRRQRDGAGVVHEWREALLGEAMHGGPLVLSWPAVQRAGLAEDETRSAGCVVIHEFMHKMDMRAAGTADGAPPLPDGFMGAARPREAARLWQRIWSDAYAAHRQQCTLAERFGGAPPWLDAYAAKSPAEFFATACEAHFVQPARFAEEFPSLATALRAFFRQSAP